jgi:hypothetical protein
LAPIPWRDHRRRVIASRRKTSRHLLSGQRVNATSEYLSNLGLIESNYFEHCMVDYMQLQGRDAAWQQDERRRLVA